MSKKRYKVEWRGAYKSIVFELDDEFLSDEMIESEVETYLNHGEFERNDHDNDNDLELFLKYQAVRYWFASDHANVLYGNLGVAGLAVVKEDLFKLSFCELDVCALASPLASQGDLNEFKSEVKS